MCQPHRGFHSCRNEIASKGREGGSVRDDSPAGITELTYYGGVGGCLASMCRVAWSRDSWENCALCQPGGRQRVPHQAVACLHSSDYNKLSQHLALHSRHVPVPVWLGQLSPGSINTVRK